MGIMFELLQLITILKVLFLPGNNLTNKINLFQAVFIATLYIKK